MLDFTVELTFECLLRRRRSARFSRSSWLPRRGSTRLRLQRGTPSGRRGRNGVSRWSRRLRASGRHLPPPSLRDCAGSCFLSLSLTHTLSQTQSHYLPLSLALTLSLSLTLALTLSLTLSLSLSLPLSLSLFHSLSLSLPRQEVEELQKKAGGLEKRRVELEQEVASLKQEVVSLNEASAEEVAPLEN